jgi:hypothetical protein
VGRLGSDDQGIVVAPVNVRVTERSNLQH